MDVFVRGIHTIVFYFSSGGRRVDLVVRLKYRRLLFHVVYSSLAILSGFDCV